MSDQPIVVPENVTAALSAAKAACQECPVSSRAEAALKRDSSREAADRFSSHGFFMAICIVVVVVGALLMAALWIGMFAEVAGWW